MNDTNCDSSTPFKKFRSFCIWCIMVALVYRDNNQHCEILPELAKMPSQQNCEAKTKKNHDSIQKQLTLDFSQCLQEPQHRLSVDYYEVSWTSRFPDLFYFTVVSVVRVVYFVILVFFNENKKRDVVGIKKKNERPWKPIEFSANVGGLLHLTKILFVSALMRDILFCSKYNSHILLVVGS